MDTVYFSTNASKSVTSIEINKDMNSLKLITRKMIKKGMPKYLVKYASLNLLKSNWPEVA